MTDFGALEEVDGVRLSWNLWPNSKLEATKCIIPFGAVYSPNKRLPSMPVRAARAASSFARPRRPGSRRQRAQG
jgi:hypothetical protein